jgi:hypothetical protein
MQRRRSESSQMIDLGTMTPAKQRIALGLAALRMGVLR